MHQIFWRFLRHIGTFLDYLGGVDRPTGRAPAPKYQVKLSKYMGRREVNISASFRVHAPFFLDVPWKDRNISRLLGRC